MARTTHIAVVSIPSFSHQASIIEFCKKLLHVHQHFHITCIFPTFGTPILATVTLFESLPSNIECIFLPPVQKENLPQDLDPALQFSLAVSQSMPSCREALSSLSSTNPFSALIVDPFANEALEIAKEFNLLSFSYFPISTMALSLLLHLPTLHHQVSGEYRDQNSAIRIPGCIAINGQDLPQDFNDRSSLSYELILQRSKRFSLADGFLVNSFSEMEGGTVRALQEQNRGNRGENRETPVFLVGPIIQSRPISDLNGPDCLRWLENQGPKMVLYVSFGSGCTLSQEQLNELAFGLELSGHKFLWVLRAPTGAAASDDDDLLQFLPHGFLKRTEGQGSVVPSWAPQIEILSHASTGGFFTHCGWNSTLESIVLGVPMITLPLFHEQRMNAVLLTEGLKAVVRPKMNEIGVAGREEISKVIKGLMLGEEGKGIRQRIKELKDAAADALKEDGSSTRAIFQFGTLVKKIML